MTYFMQENYSVYDLLPCSVAVFLINKNLDVVYSNAVYNEMFGKSYISVNDADRPMFDSQVASAEKPQCVYFRSRDAHDKKINVRAFVVKISEETAFALFIDDSENMEVIKRLDNQCARYAAAISGTDEIFFEYRCSTDELTIFFSSKEGIVTRDIKDFIRSFKDNKFITDTDKKMMRAVFKDGIKKETRLDIHMRLRLTDKFEWYTLIIKPDKRRRVYVGSTRNINKSKLEKEKLKEKALFDPLSKVYNRAAAIERIEERLKNRSSGRECALIVLDIDNFKNINDTFGHLYGDAVIAMAAGSIKSALSNEDIVGRFGGDEFFAFIDDAEKESLERKIENIRLAVFKMRLDRDDENDISCSIGVALGKGGSEYGELFKKADSALYEAKESGKNRFKYFSGVYKGDGGLSYAGNKDEDESNEAHNIIAVALEIASKSTNAENAVANIMRHIGMAEELDVIQIFKFDTVEDKVYIEFQWWRESNGSYNVVMTDKKVGYYSHNDLLIFKNRFDKDKIFEYTPDFKEGFSQKYRDVFEKSEHINTVYSSNTANENVFYSVSYQTFNKGRVWSEEEFSDMSEITKILSMYLKSAYVVTEREKMLIKRIDYDWTGMYSIGKFYEEAGRIGRVARFENAMLGVMHIDIKALHEINVIYGRGAGDRVMDAVIEAFERADPARCIISHINGTDIFIVLFIANDKLKVVETAEREFTKISDKFSEYTEVPVILKAGVAFFKPGDYIVDYLDEAKAVKKNMEFSKSGCVVAENVRTQYKNKNQYITPDRRTMY